MRGMSDQTRPAPRRGPALTWTVIGALLLVLGIGDAALGTGGFAVFGIGVGVVCLAVGSIVRAINARG